MSLLKEFVYKYFCPYLWWMLFLSCIGAGVVNLHNYTVHLSEKVEETRLAEVRYSQYCRDQKMVFSARYENQCDTYKRQSVQNAYWEAFVIIARNWQLCDQERGCSASVYIIGGIVFGAVLLLWGLNKAPKHYMEYIDRLNDDEDAKFIYRNSDGSSLDDWMPAFLSGKDTKHKQKTY